MDFDLLGSVGWREGLIAIIALLLLYIVLLYVRMRRLQSGLSAVAVPQPVAQAALAAYTAVHEVHEPPPVASPSSGDSTPLAPAVSANDSPVDGEVPDVDLAWNDLPAEIPGQALIEALQRDVYQLRGELDDLRSELASAREDFREQLVQCVGPPQATTAPMYNDAMQMAAQGHDATTIAQHCGIARAEADLVVALARNRRDGV